MSKNRKSETLRTERFREREKGYRGHVHFGDFEVVVLEGAEEHGVHGGGDGGRRRAAAGAAN